jgi:hypothetical protein
MPGRKIADETDAHACLEAASRSGLPRAEWARAHGVDARSLNAWRLNLQRRSAVEREPTTLRLVELVGEGRPATTQASGVRLVVDDLVVEVDRGFDAGTLGRVFDLVAPC